MKQVRSAVESGARAFSVGTRNDDGTSTPRWWQLRRWENTRIGAVFSADLRSLALFRIVMAVVVFVDVLNRVGNLRVHYTDEGVLPRSLLLDSFVRWRWSVNLINDLYAFQMVCLVITAAAAVGLALGYRTRTMSVIVWVMITSLQVRNPLVLSGADTFLRVLLFWMMFLPLGQVWSLDSVRSGLDRRRLDYRFLSLATVGLYVQIASLYVFTAILKSSPEWRTDGTALEYALHAHHVTKPFGEYLSQFPELLRVFTHGSLALEFLVPVLLFLPWFNGQSRTLAVASIMMFHAGIFLTMDVGLFPWISALCMTSVLPTWFWDTALRRVSPRLSGWLDQLPRRLERFAGVARERVQPAFAVGGSLQLATTVHTGDPGYSGHRDAGSSAESPPEPPAPVEDDEPPRVVRSLPITNLFMAFCIVFVLLWNVATVSAFTMPAETRPFAYGTGLYQSWNMFAPAPSKATVWIVVRGVLADGREIDVLTPIVHQDLAKVPPLSWEQPDDIVGEYYTDKYWRKYLTALTRESKQDERRAFAAYTCRTWNAHYGGDVALEGVQIYRMRQSTVLDGDEAPVRRNVLSQFRCV